MGILTFIIVYCLGGQLGDSQLIFVFLSSWSFLLVGQKTILALASCLLISRVKICTK